MAGLDRVITIQRQGGGRDDSGRFTSFWTDVARVWATRSGLGSIDMEVTGGTREVESVAWLVRWTSVLAPLDARSVRIVDAAGVVWNVQSIAESDAREVSLTFATVREVT